jgi:hypothetical protein
MARLMPVDISVSRRFEPIDVLLSKQVISIEAVGKPWMRVAVTGTWGTPMAASPRAKSHPHLHQLFSSTYRLGRCVPPCSRGVSPEVPAVDASPGAFPALRLARPKVMVGR